jgi:hypothetical protein
MESRNLLEFKTFVIKHLSTLRYSGIEGFSKRRFDDAL